MIMASHLKLVSLNCTGLGEENRRLLYDFLECYSPDIMLLQETWLLKRDLDRLNQLHSLYMGRGISSVPDTDVLQGRPYGGLAVLWRKSLSTNISFIHCEEKRLQPLVLSLKNKKTVFICNVYFPIDNRCVATVCDTYAATLDSLEICMHENLHDYILLGGDFNTDFTRCNAHANYLKEFLQRNMLVCTSSTSAYTFIGPNNTKSCIDHFMVDNTLLQSVENTQILDYTIWPKEVGHIPISIEIEHSLEKQGFVDSNSSATFSTPAWHRIKSFEAYKNMLDILLDSHDLSAFAQCLKCTDMSCVNEEHHKQIDTLCQTLSDICIQASLITLPQARKKKGLPEWKSRIQPLRDEAHFWGCLWKDCGKPSQGEVLNIYRNCRKKYHNAVKKIKHHDAKLRREEMAKQIAENRTRDLWKEFNKMKPRSRVLPPNINGKTDPGDICNIFYEKTKSLFNSVPCNLAGIRSALDSSIHECKINDVTITTMEVKEAIGHLKERKSDGHKGLWSTLVTHSTEKWQQSLSHLVSAMMVHGHYASELLLSTVHFLPKDLNKNLCDSENYRGISLYSCINKVIEWIILMKFQKIFISCELQFSYKKNHSTTICTTVLKEVVKYYFERKGVVQCALLDATKAFDRVNLDILFDILLKRGLPVPVTRLLLDMYSRQTVRTSWNNQYSDTFSVTNGVRQGGVMSPILFTLYIDELLKELESLGLGCYVGHQFYGGLCYADDITLLAPSGLMLQKMLKVCENFGNRYFIKFNVKKTVCIQFTKSRNKTPPCWIKFNGEHLKWESSVKHLGNLLNNDLNESGEVRSKQCDFIGKSNSVMANFRTVPREICSILFNRQCCSFHGCEAWNLTDPSVNKIFITWRKSVRRLWNLPPMARSALLNLLMNCPTLSEQIFQRCRNIYTTMLNNKSQKISYITRISIQYGGLVGNNLRYITEVTGRPDDVPVAITERANMVYELNMCRENYLYLEHFTDNEIELLISEISTF